MAFIPLIFLLPLFSVFLFSLSLSLCYYPFSCYSYDSTDLELKREQRTPFVPLLYRYTIPVFITLLPYVYHKSQLLQNESLKSLITAYWRLKFSKNSVVKSNLLRNKIYLYYSVNIGLISSCPRVTTTTRNVQIKDREKDKR